MKKLFMFLILFIAFSITIAYFAYPPIYSYKADGQVRSIEYDSITKNIKCILIDEDSGGEIIEFTARGEVWKVVRENDCIQVKLYPSLFSFYKAQFVRVDLEKIPKCSSNENSKTQQQDENMNKEIDDGNQEEKPHPDADSKNSTESEQESEQVDEII